ncbi:hypothetical protein [Helicobacter sp. T3_23-1059]
MCEVVFVCRCERFFLTNPLAMTTFFHTKNTCHIESASPKYPKVCAKSHYVENMTICRIYFLDTSAYFVRPV